MKDIKILSISSLYGPSPVTLISFQILERTGSFTVVKEEMAVEVPKEININETQKIKDAVIESLVDTPWAF